MKILIDRKWKKEGYTIGKLYLDNTPFCETLEDKDRGLKSSMALEDINLHKDFVQAKREDNTTHHPPHDLNWDDTPGVIPILIVEGEEQQPSVCSLEFTANAYLHKCL